MTSEYVKLAQNLRLFFLVRNASTGAADSTFTATAFSLQIGKDLAGNQSTTGCTFGVLDSTNNPGIAYLDCSGSSSFVSATGNYSIKVTRTSDLARIWTETVRVTADGTGSGTWGSLSFTAAASNGRVMSGGSPLSDATVRVVSGANILAQTTTDSSGLWGTIYLDSANATYTIQVQRSGYTLGTGTITVSGGVVTGPGADISITTAASSNTLTAADQWAYARRMLTDNTGSKSDTLVREIVDDALAYLAMTKEWPYLLTLGQIETVAPYSTGTVSIANGATTVTLVGGTWPTWAASGAIYINGNWGKAVTRTNGTTLELAEPWGDADVSAGSYTLVQYAYDLPSNLLRIDKILFNANWPYQTECSAAKLEYLRTLWQTGNGAPWHWAISAAQMLLWPYPDTTYAVHILYYKRPALLVSGSDVLEWDPMQIMVLRRAIDYQCALRGECVAGTLAECRATLDEAIDTVFSWDKTGNERDLETGRERQGWDGHLRGDIV